LRIGDRWLRENYRTLLSNEKLSIGLSDGPLLFNIPLTIFNCGALVVGLFALGQRNLRLDQVILPIEFGADACITFLLNRGKQPGQLLLMQEQFLYTTRVGDDVGARGVQRRDVATQQKCLAIFY
jgi:hypothetical protein